MACAQFTTSSDIVSLIELCNPLPNILHVYLFIAVHTLIGGACVLVLYKPYNGILYCVSYIVLPIVELPI